MKQLTVALLVLLLAACGSTPQAQAVPTFTPTPAYDLADLDYVESAGALIDDYASHTHELKSVVSDLVDDPSLLVDNQWRLRAAAVAGQFRATNELVRQLEPTDRTADIHAQLVEAANHNDQGMELFTGGLDTGDIEMLNQCMDELHAGADAAEEALHQLDSLVSR